MTSPYVLIVDDDAALLQALPETLRLRMKGVVIDTCDNAHAALELIAQVDYDAIISDIKMPGMDGLALLAEIRKIRPNTPTVLITGHGEHDLAIQALRGGAYDFIQKPIDREYFVVSLARAINMRSLSRIVEEQQRALERHASELEHVVEERTRELREANKAKDEFLATVSHELRTPLTAILGWARLLRTGKLDSESFTRAIETIERNAKSQAQLIEDILDVSRIITGKLRVNMRTIDPAPVIEAAIDAVRPAAQAKAIELEFCHCLSDCAINGDPDRLQQVVWNLLSNAVKFTPPEGRVVVELNRHANHVEIVVADTGKGIPADFLPYVFDRFRQADSTSTRSHGGLGLGLALVHHMVELHSGSVHAASDGEDKGSRFTVRLPLAATAKLKLHKQSKRPDISAPQLSGITALIVDDEIDSLEILSEVLKQFGAQVIAVNSTQEALAALEGGRPDVLISDIGMPDEDGYALIRKVRLRAPDQGGTIPAAALTAYARAEDRARALMAGFQIHLPKPIEPLELAHVVANLAGRAHTRVNTA